MDEIREQIEKILQEQHEGTIIDNRELDSFDLVTLVTELQMKLEEAFDVEIPSGEFRFIADNSDSPDKLAQMIMRLKDE